MISTGFFIAILVTITGVTLFEYFSLCFRRRKERQEHQDQIKELGRKMDQLIFDKKSTEVRTGMIVEKLAPMSDIYPFNPENAHFLGQPIDYIQFDEDAIRIVEIKSGNAQLSRKQRNIKKLIKEGKVEFHTLRVDHITEEDSHAQPL